MDNLDNIGYKPNVDLFEDFCRISGVDYDMAKSQLNMSFRDYIANLREKKGMNEPGYVPSEEDLEDLNITEDEFDRVKDDIRIRFEQYKDYIKQSETTVEEVKEYKPDYRKILNGVFTKLDKTQLTPEQKVALNVHGLLDVCYDIYLDEKTGNLTPVYYDLDTVNEHFYVFSVYLEKLKESLGPQAKNLNPYVPLILFDRDLMHIDTDHVNDIQIAVKIREECRINPFYYFREVARTFDKETGKYIRYQMTIASYTYLWLFCQCINTYREQSRQTGKTYDMTQTGGMEFDLGSRNTTIMVVHFKSAEAGKNRRNMINMVNHIPAYLKFHCIRKKLVKGKEVWTNGPDLNAPDMSKTIVNQFFNNTLKTAAVGATESSASQVGRGDTLQFVFIDELNYIRKANTVLTAVQFAHGMARTIAEKAGDRFGMHFASTAGERNTDYGKEMYELVHNEMCKFDPILFSYKHEDLVKYLQINAKKDFFVISYNYQELGFGETWLESQIKLSTTREKFQQDVLNVWLAVNKDSIFSIEQMTRMSQRSSVNTESTYMYNKYHRITYFDDNGDDFWNYISKHKNIGIGIDIALGTTNDYTVISAIDLETAEPLFIYRNNTLTGYDFALLAISFFKEMRKRNPNHLIIINPEIDGPGQIVIPMLVSDPIVEPMIFRSVKFYNKYFTNGTVKATTKHLNADCYIQYGTSMQKWRTHLYDTLLFLLVDKYPYAFDYSEAFNELTTLMRKPGGRIDHKPGFHDDVVVATLHAYSLIFVNEFRSDVEKNFKFVVDFAKIESIPLSSHISTYEKATKNQKIEGKLEWKIVTKRDRNGQLYDELYMTKIEDGRLKVLTQEEIAKVLKTNPDIANDGKIKNMRLRSYDVNQIIQNSFDPTNNLRVIDSLSNSTKRTRDQLLKDNNGTGSSLSNYNKRDTNYMRSISNNFNASLI